MSVFSRRPIKSRMRRSHGGELRSDLYYRLNVFNIHMPPLREHKEDIPSLVQLLLAEMSTKHGRKVAAVSEAVLNQFNNYSWPGNVRELRNTLERAVIVCDAGVVETKHLPPGFGQAPLRTAANDPDAVRLGVGTTVEEAERNADLEDSRGDQQQQNTGGRNTRYQFENTAQQTKRIRQHRRGGCSRQGGGSQ